MKNKFLLSDETKLSDKNFKLRTKLYNQLKELPIELLSKMRHFQPQFGCPNNCGFCSQFSSPVLYSWDEETLRNIVSAIKVRAKEYRRSFPYLAWARDEHRIGVVFPYLNNDIANYKYLNKFIELSYRELGVKTRISTVGYSRKNKSLDKMHKFIVENYSSMLAGVRISVAPFGKAWEDCEGFNLEEFEKDLVNTLQTYKIYYDKYGSGSRKFCCELRYKPLVNLEDVVIDWINEHMVIKCDSEILISIDKRPEMIINKLSNAYNHKLEFEYKPQGFKLINSSLLNSFCQNFNFNIFKDCETVDVYKFENYDGEYYSINPVLSDLSDVSFCIYPKTEKREKSGIVYLERFLLNALKQEKSKYGLKLDDAFENATWENVKNVLNILKKQTIDDSLSTIKRDYIKYEVLPLVEIYCRALQSSGFEPSCLFDKDFSIDTGIICNLGKGLNYFKGITKKFNEPLTPIHERNYGIYCSTMKQEDTAWRLSAGPNDTLIIEELQLKNTATIKGQVSVKKIITDVKVEKEIDLKYLVPGEI